jgi:GMP synthase-like glutamine amidotransferase
MTIAILETGGPPPELDLTHGDYPSMFIKALNVTRPFKVYKAYNGELPDMDEDLSGLLITGSPSGVYEAEVWIADLMDYLRGLDPALPVVGICFGHQIMAQAWGGRVEKSHKGWGIGLHEYKIYDLKAWEALGGRGQTSISVAVSHQDQVVEKPQEALVLAGSDFTPFGSLYYTQRKALSFQCHPEFCEGFAEDLLRVRRGKRIEATLADQALMSLKAPSDRELVLGAIAKFLAA